MVLEACKSKVQGTASSEDLLPISSLGRRWNGRETERERIGGENSSFDEKHSN